MQMQSENINELITSLAKAQGDLKPALKNSTNPHFKSKYADLNEVWEACREALSKNNLAVVQTTDKDEKGALNLITTLAHSSGQWIKSRYPIVCKDHNNPQALGSGITYARRYSLSSIVGIASDEDDDGNKANSEDKRKVKKEEDLKSEYVTSQQIEELTEILDDCDPQYIEKVWNGLLNLNPPIQSYEQLKVNTWKKFKEGALKNREEYKSMKKKAI